MFNEETTDLLNADLDPKLISTLKNGAKYITGHVAIAQANRIFQPSEWGYKPLDVELTVIHDVLTGEVAGCFYEATVEVQINGAVPVTDIGICDLATSSIQEHILNRRSQYKKDLEKFPPEAWEIKQARIAIIASHMTAKKGAVTDAVKRALRSKGAQFANELYREDVPTEKSEDGQSNGGQNNSSQSNGQGNTAANSGQSSNKNQAPVNNQPAGQNVNNGQAASTKPQQTPAPANNQPAPAKDDCNGDPKCQKMKALYSKAVGKGLLEKGSGWAGFYKFISGVPGINVDITSIGHMTDSRLTILEKYINS